MKKVIVGKSKGLEDAEQCDIHVVIQCLRNNKINLIDMEKSVCNDCGNKNFYKPEGTWECKCTECHSTNIGYDESLNIL